MRFYICVSTFFRVKFGKKLEAKNEIITLTYVVYDFIIYTTWACSFVSFGPANAFPTI